MRSPRHPCHWVAVMVLLGYSIQSVAAQAPPDALVARLHAYLEDYETKLSAMVADERFEQTITVVSESGTTQLPTRRVLESEMGFVRLPDGHAWMGHRRVQTINGRPVRADAPRLADLFAGTDTARRAISRQIADENARHNLGHPRTTNVPTLPLDLLHPRHRSAYAVSMGGTTTRDGVQVRRLDFAEGRKGALVAYDERSAVRTVVAAWVEVETGALQRAEVTLIPPVPARENHIVGVEFEPHPQMHMRVPVRLTERFWSGGTGEGKATYRNYRRFETAARIVPP